MASPGSTFAQGIIGAGNALSQIWDPRYRLNLRQMEQDLEAGKLANESRTMANDASRYEAEQRSAGDEAVQRYQELLGNRNAQQRLDDTMGLDFSKMQTGTSAGPSQQSSAGPMSPFRFGASSPVDPGRGRELLAKKPQDLFEEAGAGAYRYVNPVARGIADSFEERDAGYGKSSVAAALNFTQNNPQLVAKVLDTVRALRETGRYDNILLDNIESYAQTDVRQAQSLLSRELFKPDSAKNVESAIRPEKVETKRQITRAGIESEFGAREDTPGSFKQSQYVAANYANRIRQAQDNIEALEGAGFDPSAIYNRIATANALEAIKSPEQKQYAQAVRNFINATLRRESGAAIAESEFDNALRQYFPLINDDPQTREQKRRNREDTFAAFRAEAGGAYNQIQDQRRAVEQDRPQEPDAGAIPAGTVEDGYRFLGGDPADPNNWEKL